MRAIPTKPGFAAVRHRDPRRYARGSSTFAFAREMQAMGLLLAYVSCGEPSTIPPDLRHYFIPRTMPARACDFRSPEDAVEVTFSRKCFAASAMGRTDRSQ